MYKHRVLAFTPAPRKLANKKAPCLTRRIGTQSPQGQNIYYHNFSDLDSSFTYFNRQLDDSNSAKI